jgi:hypothetical protein
MSEELRHDRRSFLRAGATSIAGGTGVSFHSREHRKCAPSFEGHQNRFPIAIDNDYAIWRAFNSQYWPVLYFIDSNGRIDIIISARAGTNSRKSSFNDC